MGNFHKIYKRKVGFNIFGEQKMDKSCMLKMQLFGRRFSLVTYSVRMHIAAELALSPKQTRSRTAWPGNDALMISVTRNDASLCRIE